MYGKFFHLISLFFICGLLSGCTRANGSIDTPCMIPNLTSVPSPMPQSRKEAVPNIPSYKPMPEWWQPQLNLFQRYGLYNEITRFGRVASKIVSLGNDLWISYFDSVVRYDTDSGELIYYKLDKPGEDEFIFKDLLVTRDGNLWAGVEKIHSDRDYDALAHYNRETDVFEIIHDKDGQFEQVSKYAKGKFVTSNFMAEFPSQQLAIVLNGELFSYNAETNSAQKIIGSKQGFDVETIAISDDGNIWFTVQSRDDLNIREFDPQTLQVWDYGSAGVSMSELALNSIAVKTMLIDSQKRVWVSYFNHLEPAQDQRFEWKPIDRSPIFVDIYFPDLKYGWSGVSNLYQFTDGNIWFASGIGVVKFDTKTNQWCWSAPHGEGGIAQDKNDNLWIVTEGQIYKYAVDAH